MDGVDRRIRRKTLKERLGFKGMGCCGATWGGFRPTTMDDEDHRPERQEEERENQVMEIIDLGESQTDGTYDPDCLGLVRTGSGMNLAAALLAERHLRGPEEITGDTDSGSIVVAGEGTAPGTPPRMSLMKLLEETADGGEGEEEAAAGSDMVCCVCMGRKKGAAFIPCGHTFCRVCSRELWLNRGTCPTCNRLILEILDIF